MMDLERNSQQDPEPGSTPPAPAFAAANAPSYARILFFGSDGLRPGWGLAIYALLFFCLQRLAVELAGSVELDASGLWSGLVEELGNFIAAIVPAIVLSRIERRRWSVYGLPAKQALGVRFWSGTVWGFGGITLLMVALYGFHSFSFGHLAVHGTRLARFAAFWAGLF